MKPNIFQKIALLVYISVIVLICVYFVPYQGIQNHLDFMMRYYKTNSSYHSNILNDGYGTMSYFRFLIYLFIPTLSFYFVCKYLNRMNSLETGVYKKKAKRELYVFFLFASVIIGSTLFIYVKNECSEIRKEQLESQISKINNSFDLLREELNKRPPFVYEILKDNQNNDFVPPSDGIVLSGARDILKGNVDEYDNVLKDISNVRFSVNRKTQIERNVKQLIDSESSSEDLNNMIIDYVKLFSEDGLKKKKFEFELKELSFYNIKFNVVFVFLASFILLYIIRPSFSMFKGMLKEIR